jgi:hypothetical protein
MPVEINHMSEGELNALHERLSFAFRTAGLKGDDLDRAICCALTPSLIAIEADRQAKADRRERVKLVKD